MTAGFLPAALLLLAACGGGGGGGGSGGGSSSPVVYGGNTNAAVVTTANASKLTASVIGSEETVTTILGVSAEGSDAAQNHSSGLTDLTRRLSRDFRDIAVRGKRASATQQVVPAVLVPVNETEPCDGNVGSVTTTGTIDNMTGTGTLTATFIGCLIGGITLNGPATLRVDAFDLGFFVPTDFTISFVRLTLRGSGLSIDAGGSLRSQLNIGTNTETITANLVSLNNSTGEISKTENLVFVNVYNNFFSPSSITATVSGRVFDPVHGFVNIATTAPLFFGTVTQLFPDSGQILLTGAGNSSVRVTALSASLARLALDLDGDSVVDNTATLKWTDLTGPVGSDLGDTDGDGMHNSWETANPPMDLNLNDAGLDNDGDGFSNLSEYQGGGDPNNVASIPSMLVGVVFPVASDVAVGNSNEESPGKSAIGSDGTNYLLVSCRELGPTVGLFGVTISGTGQVLSNFPIFDTTNCGRPAIAFDGINYLVVLTRNGQIYGIRVTPGGDVLDAAGGFPISTAGSNFSPAIAFDEMSYLVVWNKFVDNSQYEIYGARVTPAGGALGEFPIFTAPGEQIFPALAFDGTN
jgi:hypothetical protein